MLAVAKKPRINVEFKGDGVSDIAKILRRQIPAIQIFEDPEEELYEAKKSEWYKKTKATMTPGVYLKIRRENAGLSQKALSEKTGIAVPHISAMEHNNRPIGAKTARLFAKAIGCTVSQILGE